MKKAVYTITSIFLIVIAISGLFAWEFYFKDKVNKTKVYVATTVLNPNTTIEPEHIKVELREISSLPPDYLTDINEIIGKKAVFGLDVNDVISKAKVNEIMITEGNKGVFPIPNTWVAAVPGSLRTDDHVDIYIVADPALNRTSNQNAFSEINNEESFDEFLYKPILRDIKVAFIKDSSNKGIKPIAGDDENERTDLTGYAYQLELFMDEYEFSVIQTSILAGYKLLFAY